MNPDETEYEEGASASGLVGSALDIETTGTDGRSIVDSDSGGTALSTIVAGTEITLTTVVTRTVLRDFRRSHIDCLAHGGTTTVARSNQSGLSLKCEGEHWLKRCTLLSQAVVGLDGLVPIVSGQSCPRLRSAPVRACTNSPQRSDSAVSLVPADRSNGDRYALGQNCRAYYIR